MTILGLAESFKTMNRPDPTETLLTAYFSEKIKREGITILTQSSFKSLIYDFRIWDRYLR